MKTYFLPAIRITFLTLILFGIMYPLFIVGFSKLIGPGNGAGETVELNGKIVGFTLIGQSFTDEKYFNSRPSAVNYNAASTGGSNKSTTNPDYLKQVQQRIDTFILRNPGVDKEEIPVDLITASGGGLDPHISVSAATVQVKRIARVRGLNEEMVNSLVRSYTERPFAGMMGVSRVNVLNINLALDGATRQ